MNLIKPIANAMPHSSTTATTAAAMKSAISCVRSMILG